MRESLLKFAGYFDFWQIVWAKLARIILRNRISILLVMGVLSVFMAFMGQKVNFQYGLPELLPSDDSTLIRYHQFRAEYGKEPTVIVLGIEKNPLKEKALFNAWFQLSRYLKLIAGVDTVVSVASVYQLLRVDSPKKFLVRPLISDTVGSQAALDTLRAKIEGLPFYRNLLFNPETDASLMAISLNDKVFNSDERQALISAIVEQAETFSQSTDLRVHYSGLPFIRTVVTNMVKKELGRFILLSILITILILFVFFRSFKPIFISLLVVGLGVTWSIGTMGILGYEITILTSIIPPLLIVIGVPNCVYLINKFHKEYQTHQNHAKALTRVVSMVGKATFMTNATTAAGFATFVFTQSNLLIEFGIVAAINILLLFVFSISLIPILFSFMRAPKARHTKHLEMPWVSKFVAVLSHLVEERRKLVYFIAVILLVASVYGFSKIKSTGNIVDDLPRSHAVTVDLKFFEEHFKGVMPFEITVDAKKPRMILRHSELKKLEKVQALVYSYPEFSRPMSVVEGIKFVKQSFYGGMSDKYALIDNRERAFFKPYIDNFGGNKSILSPYLDSTYQRARITMQMADVGTDKMDLLIEELKPRLDSILDPEKYEVNYTGTSVVYLEGAKYLVKNLFISLALAILIVAGIMALLFNSFRMIVISIAVNFFPLLMTAALMGYLSIAIKPSTVLVFSIAFGISVDDTIHFLAKYRQELRHFNGNIGAAVHKALSETGVSMFYTSIILFFGFSVFISSEFGGTRALGLLVSFTLLMAMLWNLVVLPSFLLSLEKYLISKSFNEPYFELYDEEEEENEEDVEAKEGQNNLNKENT